MIQKENPMPENNESPAPYRLTLTQLAARWLISKRTITRIPASQLPYLNLPTQRRYLLDDIIAYERHKKGI